MTPNAYCEEKAARSGSTFYYRTLFSPHRYRVAATALHALCIELNQVVVGTADDTAARIKLAWWRTEIDALFRGNAQHPVTRALAAGVEIDGAKAALAKGVDGAAETSLSRFAGGEHPRGSALVLSRVYLEALIDGAEMDMLQSRYLDFPALDRYCALAGSAPLQWEVAVAGGGGPHLLRAAADIGSALCLISLIRNVGEHARRGRVYLPVDELQKFQVPVAEVLNARYSDRFYRLMAFQARRARERLNTSLLPLNRHDRKAMRPILILIAIALALLDELEADGYHVLDQRASLTPIRKFWLAWKTWVAN